MRVVVTGGQTFDDYAFVAKTLDRLHTEGYSQNEVFLLSAPITELANGKCSYGGADLLSDYWCDVHGLIPVHYPALWGRYPNGAAGPIRNGVMLQEFRPDLVVGFPGGRGTRDCLDKARHRNILVYEPPY